MEEHTLQCAAHASAWGMNVRFIAVEMPEHDGCCDGSHTVGCGDAYPHAIRTPNLGEDEQEGYEEEQLAADGHEDAAFRHTDALEEVACHNLETHDGRHADDDFHARNG